MLNSDKASRMTDTSQEDRYLHRDNFAEKYESRTLVDRILKLTQFGPGPIERLSLRLIAKRLRVHAEQDFDAALAACKPGSLCIDLGANIGGYTANCLEAGMRVIAFEPDPFTFEHLKQNVGNRSEATLHNKAVGVRADTLQLRRVTFWSEEEIVWSEGSSLVFEDHLMDDANTVDVEVIDFIAFLKAIDERIAILKVDIEGSEWELFPAIVDAGLLDKIDYLFMETHEWRDPSKTALARSFRDMARERTSPVMNLSWV